MNRLHVALNNSAEVQDFNYAQDAIWSVLKEILASVIDNDVLFR